MPETVSYAIVMDVLTSWDKLKTIKKWDDKFGELLFVGLFELEPEALKILKFEETVNITKDPRYPFLAKTMVDMIDMAVALLGPDLEPLEEDLFRLGRRHIKYGVPSRCFPFMGKACISALEELLLDSFSARDRMAWQTIFHFMIRNMVAGMGEEYQAEPL